MGNLMGKQVDLPSVGKPASRFSLFPRRGKGKSRGEPREFPLTRLFPGNREWEMGKREKCVHCQVGQGRNCACREAQQIVDSQRPQHNLWSPAANVLLILGFFVAVKLKLIAAAIVLAGLMGYAVWRAFA